MLNLPPGLNETYARCLTRMMSNDIGRKYGLRILLWILGAERHLRSAELQEAASMEDMYEAWNSARLLTVNVVKCCANLVEQDQTTARIQFAHPSVRHFLETRHDFAKQIMADAKFGFTTSNASDLASCYCTLMCLSYLSMQDFSFQMTPLRKQRVSIPGDRISPEVVFDVASGLMSTAIRTVFTAKHRNSTSGRSRHISLEFAVPTTRKGSVDHRHEFAFLRYARKYWPLHYENFSRLRIVGLARGDIWDQFRDLALKGNSSFLLQPWLTPGMNQKEYGSAMLVYAIEKDCFSLCDPFFTGSDAAIQLIAQKIPNSDLYHIHLAALLGRTRFVKFLLEYGGEQQLSLQDGAQNTALHFAATNGSASMADLFSASSLCQVRHVIAENENGDTCLTTAAHYGRAVWLERIVLWNLDSTDDELRTAFRGALLVLLQKTWEGASSSSHKSLVALAVQGMMEPNFIHRGVPVRRFSPIRQIPPNPVIPIDHLTFLAVEYSSPALLDVLLESQSRWPQDRDVSVWGSRLLCKVCEVTGCTTVERVDFLQHVASRFPEAITGSSQIESPLRKVCEAARHHAVAVQLVTVFSRELVRNDINCHSDSEIQNQLIEDEFNRVEAEAITNLLQCNVLQMSTEFLSAVNSCLRTDVLEVVTSFALSYRPHAEDIFRFATEPNEEWNYTNFHHKWNVEAIRLLQRCLIHEIAKNELRLERLALDRIVTVLERYLCLINPRLSPLLRDSSAISGVLGNILNLDALLPELRSRGLLHRWMKLRRLWKAFRLAWPGAEPGRS